LKRSAYIEFESYLRDFDYRFLLALDLANKGVDVFFGFVYYFNKFSTFGPLGSLYYAKDCTPEKLNDIRTRKSRGFKNIVLDEEANSVYQMTPKYLNYRYNKFTIDYIDYSIFGTRYEFEKVTLKYNCDKKSIKCMNPRFTLYKDFDLYKKSSEKVKKKYGSFILFPLSGSLEHVLGYEGRQKEIEGINILLEKHMDKSLNNDDFFDQYIAYEQMNIKLLNLIPLVAREFPNIKFVIRVHPSDANKNPESFLKDHPKNVIFDRSGNITPYILASDFIIHTNCTSGFDAFCAGKETINFVDKEIKIPEEYSDCISQSFGHQVNDLSSLKNAIKLILKSKNNDNKLIYNRKNDEIFSHGNNFSYLADFLYRVHSENIENGNQTYAEKLRTFLYQSWARFKLLKRQDSILNHVNTLLPNIDKKYHENIDISLVHDGVVRIEQKRKN